MKGSNFCFDDFSLRCILNADAVGRDTSDGITALRFVRQGSQTPCSRGFHAKLVWGEAKRLRKNPKTQGFFSILGDSEGKTQKPKQKPKYPKTQAKPQKPNWVFGFLLKTLGCCQA